MSRNRHRRERHLAAIRKRKAARVPSWTAFTSPARVPSPWPSEDSFGRGVQGRRAREILRVARTLAGLAEGPPLPVAVDVDVCDDCGAPWVYDMDGSRHCSDLCFYPYS